MIDISRTFPIVCGVLEPPKCNLENKHAWICSLWIMILSCYPFGSSADPFSQDPSLTATPFQNERKRNEIKWIPKWIKKGAKWEPKSIQNEQRRCSESFEETGREKTLYRYSCTFVRKRRDLSDLWWHLDSHWILKGSPNFTFLQKASIKWGKVRPLMVSQAKMKIRW